MRNYLDMSNACSIWATRYKRRYKDKKIELKVALLDVLNSGYKFGSVIAACDYIIDQMYPSKETTQIVDAILYKLPTNKPHTKKERIRIALFYMRYRRFPK